jgi:hypothetical protein
MVMRQPAKRDTATPKQSPGQINGKRTPRDMPTKAALMERMYSATIATSNPTGKNRGSRNVKVKNPDTTAVRKPEKRRSWLRNKHGELDALYTSIE